MRGCRLKKSAPELVVGKQRGLRVASLEPKGDSVLVAYVFCLVLSGVLLGISVFSDFLDVDASDIDLDGDVDLDHDIGAARILSIRGLLYFMFGFGAIGTALTGLGTVDSALVAAAVSGLGGLGSGLLATSVFGYLKRSESGATQEEHVFVGLPGRMLVPISSEGVGQVRVQRHSGTVDLVAVPYSEADGDPAGWRDVVIVEMTGGRAMVTPAEGRLQLEP